MIAFIDDHRCVHGVGPICRVLGIAPSTFYSFKAGERDSALASDRAKQDRLDMAAIKEAFDDSRGRYGARKVWHQLRREGREIARCTVERLMKTMGLQGVVRGKKVVTTNPDTAQPCPDDKVNRAFKADMPNQLWVSDFTYVSSWQGMVYVAFVIDVFARKIVGWRVSTSMTTGFVLDCNFQETPAPLRQAFRPVCSCLLTAECQHSPTRKSCMLSIRVHEAGLGHGRGDRADHRARRRHAVERKVGGGAAQSGRHRAIGPA